MQSDQITIKKEYLVRLFELAKELEQAEDWDNVPVVYKERFIKFFGYISALESLVK